LNDLNDFNDLNGSYINGVIHEKDGF
jgi:hypothetical protein